MGEAASEAPAAAGRELRTRAFMARLASRIRGLPVLARGLLAIVLGAGASLAMPPFFALPLLIPAFTGLLWMIEGARRHSSVFVTVWLFAIAYFVIGLYWVGIAFTVEAEKFAWMIPFAVGGLAALLGLFPATLLTLGRVVARRLALGPVAWVVLFALAWLIGEWLRGWVLTGFPWNLVGAAWTFSTATMQPASVLGVWGLSFFTVLGAASPACLAGLRGWRGWCLPVVSAAVIAAAAGYGAVRVANAPPPGERTVQGVGLRIVQGAIDQRSKWKEDVRQRALEHYIRLSRRSGFAPNAGTLTHVIWPETAVAYFLQPGSSMLPPIGSAAPEGGVVITGAPRLERGDDRDVEIWNSLFVVTSEGRLAARYDKRHLVPFGEYVPLRDILPVEKLTHGRLDFTAGSERGRLQIPGAPPMIPLICYEIIFPDEIVPAGERPGWLLNITNDAWFGTSSGPFQHFANARLRAVEQGLPLVRAANTGISAVVDPYGRVWQRLNLGVSGTIDAGLPVALSPTVYARIGEWSIVVLAVIALAAMALVRPLDRAAG